MASRLRLAGTGIFQKLPPEIWTIICEFLGQESAHMALRTCRVLFGAINPIAWRKVVLAPHPQWVNIEARDEDTDWDWDRPTGHVDQGFIRTKRLITSAMRDLLVPDIKYAGRWRGLSYCYELTICEIMDRTELATLFELMPNVRKANIYMGNFLHWYREAHMNSDQGFAIGPYRPPGLEVWAGPETSGQHYRPRLLCESVPRTLSCPANVWSAGSVTHLTIDCEAHLQPDYMHARYSFFDELYAAHRLHNIAMMGWFDSFPNIQTLKCGSWFLELLWSACYLQNVTRGTGADDTDPPIRVMIRAAGIGGLPKSENWPRLHKVTIQSFEDEYPEIHYRRSRSIVEPHIWTFLSVFQNLKTIRCEVGPWKVLHRYPGGFDIVPHIESLVGLAALQICQRLNGWDVKIEDFIINLRDVETLITPEIDQLTEWVDIPALPYMPSGAELGSLLDFIRGIGWTGYVSVPDCTDWWNGPTWRFWLPDVVAPPVGDFRPIGQYFATINVQNITDEDWIPWELHPGDGHTTSVLLLLQHYIGAIEHCQDWKHLEGGLHIYHESCWYRSLLHPSFRHMGNAQYDEQLVRFLATRKQTVKGLALTTNNATSFFESWNDLDDQITEVCYDAFDYRVRDIVIARGHHLSFKPRLELIGYHARADVYDSLSRWKSLRELTIVNFQWAFDREKAGPRDDSGSNSGGNSSRIQLQNIEDVLDDSESLQKLKLVGDIFMKTDGTRHENEPRKPSMRRHMRNVVRSVFKNADEHKHKIDLDWMRFKYVSPEWWASIMAPGTILRAARAGVRWEYNRLPAFNQHPPHETWDEIHQWNEVELQGWKVLDIEDRYRVSLDFDNMHLDLRINPAGYNGTMEERMAAWSARLHPEKDAPWDPVTMFFCRYNTSTLSRFRMQIRDFYQIHPRGMW